MEVEDIRKVLIIGSGTMGQQIGFECARHGYDVVMYDVSADGIENAKMRMEKITNGFVKSGALKAEDAESALARMRFTTEPNDARDADIVSESVPEDPALKGKVFSQFNGICPERTIFTTNTSSLVPSQFSGATGRPEKLVALHFHDTRYSRIVDVMPHPGTSQETVKTVIAFARKIGQIPIVLHKENNGYVYNTMLMSLINSALVLRANDVASVEDIDRSWMGVMHTFVGPFGIMDSIGLDTVHKVQDYWANMLNDPQGKKNAELLKSYTSKGELGAKSGKGFYTYPHPAFTKPGFIEGDE
jgi:3-hydroxybutyryl-CoA dehydrogenase